MARDLPAPDTHRGRLFRKYLLLILSLVTIVLLASSSINLYFSYQENRAALGQLQREKALGAASRIEQYIRQVSRQLEYVALPQLDAGDGETRRIEFLKLLRQAPEVTDIAQLDSSGREQIAVSRLGMDVVASGKDRSAEPAFQKARRAQPWYGPVYFRKETEPYMTVAVRSGGEKSAVTVAEVNLKFIWEVISRIKIGAKGKAYVVDGNSLLVADPDIGLVLRKTSLDELPHVKAAVVMDGADDVAMVSKDLAGTPVLTSVAAIEPLDWKVFVEQPISEVYAKLDASLVRTGLLLVAGLVISALAAAILARSMVRPIRTLDEGARRIGAGDLDKQIVIETGDELEALADQFNRMTVQLRESYAELERKVVDRTAELTEALEHQTATSEVLRVIGSSVADAQPVFAKILHSCQRLFESTEQGIMLIGEDRQLHLGAHRGDTRETVAMLFPMPMTDDGPTAISIRERQVLHYPNVLDGVDVPASVRETALRMGTGAYSQAFAPMLWEGQGVGTIYVVRNPPRPFAEKELNLLKIFSDQAVIAIQNTRLFHEIEDKSRQLELANRHKSEFLSNMSHELRTPLNAIIGFSEVLTEQMFGDVNAKQMEYLHDIHSSGQHLLTLINDVLDLSKIEAGRMELNLHCFDLGLLLDNSLTLVRERAQRQGLAITLEVGDGLEEWVADARKVKQVVVNLLSNAVKFTPTGGSVALRARRADVGDAGGSEHAMAEISVADTGVGIAPEEQAAVFEEFRQARGDYLRKTEGTGLGLSLAKRFAELHGGTVRIASERGQGATFTVTLPLLVLEAIV